MEQNQLKMMEELSSIKGRLKKLENDFEKVKGAVADIESKQEMMESNLDEVWQQSNKNGSLIQENSFELDRLEQYSRKSSICVLNLKEEMMKTCKI
eukprot:gene20775-22803_t